MRSVLPETSLSAPLLPLLLPLCFLVTMAGVIDSLMFMHSSDLLAVYMSGNTSKLGRTLALGQWPALFPLAAVIAAFFVTATLAAWLGKRCGHRRAAVNLALTSALLLAAWSHAHEQYSPVTVATIAAAMGALNQVIADEPGITFLTGALIRLSRSIVDRDGKGFMRDAMRWLAWLLGAMAGTWLDIRIEAPTLLLVAIAFALAALVCEMRARRRHLPRDTATGHP